jgi:hypothetical protein
MAPSFELTYSTQHNTMMIRWLRLPMLYDYLFSFFLFFNFFFIWMFCFSKHGFNCLMHCVVFFYFGCENGLHEWTFWLVGLFLANWDCRLIWSALTWLRLFSFSMRDGFCPFHCTIWAFMCTSVTLMMSACFLSCVWYGHCLCVQRMKIGLYTMGTCTLAVKWQMIDCRYSYAFILWLRLLCSKLLWYCSLKPQGVSGSDDRNVNSSMYSCSTPSLLSDIQR